MFFCGSYYHRRKTYKWFHKIVFDKQIYQIFRKGVPNIILRQISLQEKTRSCKGVFNMNRPLAGAGMMSSVLFFSFLRFREKLRDLRKASRKLRDFEKAKGPSRKLRYLQELRKASPCREIGFVVKYLFS